MADGQLADSEPWYSAADLVGLSGLPSTERGIHKIAERNQWRRRPKRQGKGWEYALSSLSGGAQHELRRRGAIAAANRTPYFDGQTVGRPLALQASAARAVQQREREAGTARAAGLTGAARDRMNAKLDVLGRFEAFARHHAGICAAREAFCAAYCQGDIDLPMSARHWIGDSISPATLGRWQRQIALQGTAALAGRYGNRAGTGTIECQPALCDFVLGLLTAQPHIRGKNLHRAMSARFACSEVRVPSVRGAVRFLSRFKRENAQLYAWVSNPDAAKNRYMSAFGSASEDVVRLNQRWELDSTPADVLLVDGRHTIVQVVDIWSRRRLFYVAKTSSAAAVCGALRRAVLTWGLPEQVKIDHGKDYVAERVQRAFRGLGANVLMSPPFSPWKKPHVERGFRTFLHGLVELLPGYIGHNVAQAQAIRAGQSFSERMFKKNAVVDMRLTADELQRFCDRWCTDVYEHTPTDALGGKTVFERVASWTGEVRRITGERALDLLLAEAPDGDGGRTVTKKGLRVDSLTYIAPELDALVGERVQVFYDERDVGRLVVYHNGAFACVAECPEVSGVRRAEVAAIAAELRRTRLREQRAEMRRLKRKANVAEIAHEILDRYEQQNSAVIPSSRATDVILLTPEIETAHDAVQALDMTNATRPPSRRDIALRELDPVHDEMAFPIQGETAKGRFLRALDLLLVPETERSPDDQRWLARFTNSAEFHGAWLLFESFGPSGLGYDERFAALLP